MSAEIMHWPVERTEMLEPLYEAVWPKQSGHGSYIRWAFQSNPLGEAPIVVARDEETDHLVAARPSLRWPLETADGSRPKIYQFGGTCVHPEFRRRGLFSRTNELFLDTAARTAEPPTIFNVSVAAARKGYEKLGWSYISGFRRYIRIGDKISFALKLARAPKALRAPTRVIKPLPGGPLTDFERLEPMARKRQQTLRGFHHTYYDRDIFEWRFSPARCYYRDVLVPGSGWCVYKLLQRGPFLEAEIGDIWLNRDSASSLRAIISKLIRRDHPELLTMVISRAHPLRKRLWLAGFVPDPKGDLNFGVRLLDKERQEFLEPRNWAVTTAVLDTY